MGDGCTVNDRSVYFPDALLSHSVLWRGRTMVEVFVLLCL